MTDAGTTPNVPFFKKRSQNRNVRKRNLSDDDNEGSTSSIHHLQNDNHTQLSTVSKKRSLKSRVGTELSTSSKAQLAQDELKDQGVGVAYRADLTKGNERIDYATKTNEIDTAYDRDSQAIIERHLAAVEAGLDDRSATVSSSEVYKGIAGYKSHVPKREQTNSKMRVGPIRASSNIRITNRFDYQPDICKDYKETGFCGYGDSCIYMHDRGDYKAGWQLDQEWEAEQRAKKAALIQGLDDDDDESDDDEDDDIPFACLICREEFKHPIVTKCGHYFCESCAIKRYAKTPKCAACQQPTAGLFNAAPKDFTARVQERKQKIEDAQRRRAEDDAAAEAAERAAEEAAERQRAFEHARQDATADNGIETGMVEDTSVVGMGGIPPQLPTKTTSTEISDDDSDDDDDHA
ncbi:hypothetical protein DFQ26_004219 [Actinomortierella ambigua]|nr:hypothetical protein DFQ26_004219 [Actinomortierella ambigua]